MRENMCIHCFVLVSFFGKPTNDSRFPKEHTTPPDSGARADAGAVNENEASSHVATTVYSQQQLRSFSLAIGVNAVIIPPRVNVQ